MEKEMCAIQENLEETKAKAEVLRSTLLAIYVALTENVYDGVMYVEAIHGSVHLAQELMEDLQETMKAVSKEEHVL